MNSDMSVICTSSSSSPVNVVRLLLIMTVSIGNAHPQQQQQSIEGDAPVTSGMRQQQQQSLAGDAARFGVESTSGGDGEAEVSDRVSTFPTMPVSAGVNEMARKQLPSRRPSASPAAASNDSDTASVADDQSRPSYSDGDYRQRAGDYFDDYQYDYGYDYNSYVSKDDLLRYDYKSNYDYRQRRPVYNYSIHHPGAEFSDVSLVDFDRHLIRDFSPDERLRHMMPSDLGSRSEPINMSLLVIYLWLALVAVMVVITVVIVKYKQPLEAASHRCISRLCCRHRRSVGVDEGNTLLSHSLV